jgi:predicted MFS family arabinose efflux permease
MLPLAVVSFTGFAGYAILLPVAPLWAVRGGADTAGAGLVNGVLLLATVLTQLLVPALLRRLGWGRVLVPGMLMLGVPAALYATSDGLGVVLLLSALRGTGFGVLTVVGSSAVGALVDVGRRGEAIGAYGLAVAVPNLLLLPAGPWVAENVGYGAVFGVAALPVAGVLAALRLATVLEDAAPDLRGRGAATPGDAGHHERDRTVLPRLLPPTLLLLSVTLAGGAAITFLPQMVDGALLSGVALLVLGLVAAVSRWRAGTLADRYGPGRFLVPLVLLTAGGSFLLARSVEDPAATPVVLLMAAMVVLGLAYGALQNLTLVLAFAAVSRRHHHTASAVWNVGFDAGTALGSVAVGVLAQRSSFTTAFLVVAAVGTAALPVAAALRRR